MSNLFDASNAPTTEPGEITAGDFVQWKRTDLSSDYPTGSYTLSYILRLQSTTGRKISISASDDGNGDYLVSLASATTAGYDAGTYNYDTYITRDSDSARIKIGGGQMVVTVNKATDATDPRSLAARMVAKIEAAIEQRADNHQLDVLSYDLGIDASATRDPAKLLEHLMFWKRELVKENRKARARAGKGGGSIKVRF
jgi:hypothetical protein